MPTWMCRGHWRWPGPTCCATRSRCTWPRRPGEPVTAKATGASDLESRDVYADLDVQGALALASPYWLCDKVTLHVASPTGGAGDSEGEGGIYPRGVTPRRVLRPLVAMLAMTGVLPGAEAGRVGI